MPSEYITRPWHHRHGHPHTPRPGELRSLFNIAQRHGAGLHPATERSGSRRCWSGATSDRDRSEHLRSGSGRQPRRTMGARRIGLVQRAVIGWPVLAPASRRQPRFLAWDRPVTVSPSRVSPRDDSGDVAMRFSVAHQ